MRDDTDTCMWDTDQDRVVDYWNNIDQQLELDMDVLDDLCGEAQEVHEANNW